jgi:hypothetical protein
MTNKQINSLLVAVKKIGGTSFVGIRNYTNKQGEISNYTFNVGISYGKILQDNFTALQALTLVELIEQHGEEIVTIAYNELYESLQKRLESPEIKAELLANGDSTMIRSQAQTDAYINLTNGLKMKAENGEVNLYIYGFCLRKTILQGVEGEVKAATKSNPKTIIKRAIEKAANFKGLNYTSFKVGNMAEIKLSGISYQF